MSTRRERLEDSRDLPIDPKSEARLELGLELRLEAWLDSRSEVCDGPESSSEIAREDVEGPEEGRLEGKGGIFHGSNGGVGSREESRSSSE